MQGVSGDHPLAATNHPKPRGPHSSHSLAHNSVSCNMDWAQLDRSSGLDAG